MLVYCDTSALYAVASPADEAHPSAATTWAALVADDRYRLVTTNYVVLEVLTLAQRRQGLAAVRALSDALDETVEVTFVDAALHETALESCLTSRRRDVSLVDYVSFAFMQRHGINTAFSFDKHFTERGFKPVGIQP